MNIRSALTTLAAVYLTVLSLSAGNTTDYSNVKRLSPDVAQKAVIKIISDAEDVLNVSLRHRPLYKVFTCMVGRKLELASPSEIKTAYVIVFVVLALLAFGVVLIWRRVILHRAAQKQSVFGWIVLGVSFLVLFLVFLAAFASEVAEAQSCLCKARLSAIFRTAYSEMENSDNPRVLPADFSPMYAIGLAKSLICPADPSSMSDKAINAQDISYEIVPSGRSLNTDNMEVYCRCRIHGHYVRQDGAVISGTSK